MHTNPASDTKNFTLLRLLTVIAIVATLSAFAPWQAAPATPPTHREAFPPPPHDAQVRQGFHRQHPALSKPQMSEQPRYHFVPPLGVKP